MKNNPIKIMRNYDVLDPQIKLLNSLRQFRFNSTTLELMRNLLAQNISSLFGNLNFNSVKIINFIITSQTDVIIDNLKGAAEILRHHVQEIMIWSKCRRSVVRFSAIVWLTPLFGPGRVTTASSAPPLYSIVMFYSQGVQRGFKTISFIWPQICEKVKPRQLSLFKEQMGKKTMHLTFSI